VVAKNLDLLRLHPQVLAGHYRSIAGESRRLGDLSGARSEIRKALDVRPFDVRLWAVFSYLWVVALKP
jgi:hypothetical protein